MTLRKTDAVDKVTYTVEGMTGYVMTLWKDNDFHLELTNPWPVSEANSWQEYQTQIESGNTIV